MLGITVDHKIILWFLRSKYWLGLKKKKCWETWLFCSTDWESSQPSHSFSLQMKKVFCVFILSFVVKHKVFDMTRFFSAISTNYTLKYIIVQLRRHLMDTAFPRKIVPQKCKSVRDSNKKCYRWTYFLIIGIDINWYFDDREQRNGCERSTRGLMGSMFVKIDGWETCGILRSALPVVLPD